MAASPMPGASYMVSNISATSLRMLASIFFTGSETCRNRLSGKMRISRTVMAGDVSGGAVRVNARNKSVDWVEPLARPNGPPHELLGLARARPNLQFPRFVFCSKIANQVHRIAMLDHLTLLSAAAITLTS